MCSTCDAALPRAAAIMPFARLRSRSKPRTRSAPALVGFPEPAVSTGFVHSLLFALPNLNGAIAPILCRQRARYGGFAIAFAACHERPDDAGRFIGQRNRRHLCRAPLHQLDTSKNGILRGELASFGIY